MSVIDIWVKETNKRIAAQKTKEAEKRIQSLNNLLLNALSYEWKLDWNTLKDCSEFQEPNPKDSLTATINHIPKPASRARIKYTPKPNPFDYEPHLTLLDRILFFRKKKKRNKASLDYQSVLKSWESQCEMIDEQNEKLKNQFLAAQEKYKKEIEEEKNKITKLEKDWSNRKALFYSEREKENAKIDYLKKGYIEKKKKSVEFYFKNVLLTFNPLEGFSPNFDLDFNTNNNILVVDYCLPSIDEIPIIKEVKYIVSRNEFKEYQFSTKQREKLFDDTIYKIVLSVIYMLFNSDTKDILESINLNGWVNLINSGTGKSVNSCIVSIKADKKEFEEINLKQVEPKSCFRHLKGVGSSKLSGLVPIQPIIQLDKTDKRFVSSYHVVESIEGENLALMPWEDFEHLIRELFEEEFSTNGGEVKVTQASRDGGVDAIAFDPDPIRGGKIIIQAKRYTNTVGVSAVRDLYGTVMNEGATKGILVTTADYGPDAYNFAQNKPLTLLNGSNLLSLLDKHGHKSRINIYEARKINNQKK